MTSDHETDCKEKLMDPLRIYFQGLALMPSLSSPHKIQTVDRVDRVDRVESLQEPSLFSPVEKQALVHLIGVPMTDLLQRQEQEPEPQLRPIDGDSEQHGAAVDQIIVSASSQEESQDMTVEQLCNLLVLQQQQISETQETVPTVIQGESISADPLHRNDSTTYSFNSDEEIRVEHKKHRDLLTTTTMIDNQVEQQVQSQDDDSSASSWDIDQGGFQHYDTWTVLADEYAPDFGFGFHTNATSTNLQEELPQTDFTSTVIGPISTLIDKQDNDDDDDDNNNEPFLILGTSIQDLHAHPHVLSPPLMTSINQFLPEAIMGQNFWLKYSLIRDGASMDTLLRYVRAAQHTILAIETSDGQVLGCFTSSAWKTHTGYFGNGEAFVWNMRYSRMTPCYSLYDQANMESDVDVFPYSNLNTYVQLCTPERIAVGGGSLTVSGTDDHHSFANQDGDSSMGGGFAIMIQDFEGFTGPSATFRNPCLIQHSSTSGLTFQIVNLEVWTFTPCRTVEDAEKLEMRKFFMEESMHNDYRSSSSSSSLSHSLSTRDHHHHEPHLSSLATVVDTVVTLKHMTRHKSEHSGSDYSQKGFYRRVGESEENQVEEDRGDKWG